jgi:hypothetical protein
MNPSTTDKILSLLVLHQEHQDAAERLQNEAKREQKLADKIVREDLPELMRESDLTELMMTNGVRLVLREKIHASIPKQFEERAHQWLIDNGFGGLLNVVVTNRFGTDHLEDASTLARMATTEFGVPSELTTKVHPNTIKAFVREQFEAGRDVPQDLFGVFIYSEVEIKSPRNW